MDRLHETLRRVQLRPLREADLPEFFAYRSDPEVARLQGWEPISRHDAACLLGEFATATRFTAGAWTQIAIAELSTDRLIGDIGVHLSPDRSAAEFGITVTPAEQGKGYASEAIAGLIELLFATTPAAKIVACTDIRNTACLSALARAGMHPEGVREAEYKGERCVERIFSASRPAAGL